MSGRLFRSVVPDDGHEPPYIDTTVPQQARVYDYWLGGKDNFAADRELAEQAIRANPDVVAVARANRAFLGRAVRYLTGEAGIRQFLDIGTGIPAASNTHEVAQSFVPDARIVYVDNDPIVLSHARALLTSRPEGAVAYLDADAHDPGLILERAAEALDFGQPVAIMLLAILQVLREPHAIVAELLSGVPSGSYLAVSVPASDMQPEAQDLLVRRLTEGTPNVTVTFLSHGEVTRFFDGLELVQPGVVPVNRWRPDPGSPGAARDLPGYAALGRKA
jgi:S-adenosyl methyltransferase